MAAYIAYTAAADASVGRRDVKGTSINAEHRRSSYSGTIALKVEHRCSARSPQREHNEAQLLKTEL